MRGASCTWGGEDGSGRKTRAATFNRRRFTRQKSWEFVLEKGCIKNDGVRILFAVNLPQGPNQNFDKLFSLRHSGPLGLTASVRVQNPKAEA
jgi:hypothetical protein